uniref:Reverse transcriptase domain-containing protein n=1 Tax=Cannabis sativa TaxID=3483 RepID=A0A803Q0X9_CANSA
MDPLSDDIRNTLSLTEEESSIFTIPEYCPTSIESVLQNVTKEDLIYTPFWVQIYRLPFLRKSKVLVEALGNIIGEFIEVFDYSTNEGWGPFLQVRVKLDTTKPLSRGQMIRLPRIKDEFWVDFRYERLPKFCFECGRLGHPFERCVAFMERMDSGNDDDFQYGPWMKGSKLPTNGYDRYRTDFAKGNAWPLLTRLARSTLTSTLPALNVRHQPHPRVLLHGESSNSLMHNSTNNHAINNTPRSTNTHPPVAFTYTSTPIVGTNTQLSQTDHSYLPYHQHNSPSIGQSESHKFSASYSLQPSLPHDSSHNHSFTPSTTNTMHTPPQTQHTSSQFNKPPSLPHVQHQQPAIKIDSKQPVHAPVQSKNKELLSYTNTPIPPASTTPNSMTISSTSTAVTDLSHIYMPAIENNTFATYPPVLASIPINSNLPSFSQPQPKSPLFTYTAAKVSDSKENQPPSTTFKRHNDSLSIRKMLKRCRNVEGSSSSPLSREDDIEKLVSDLEDSSFSTNSSAEFEDNPTFHFTCFYGAPEACNRSASWTLLQHLSDVAPLLPWLVIGDFNEILSNSDKSSGALRNESQMEAFRSVVDRCRLHESPFEGDPFTWSKSRTALNTIKERIDWCFVNHLWESSFCTPQTSSHFDELKQAETILDELLEQEETYWQQRSRVDGLASGDLFTKFFYAKASARKSNNHIKFLLNDLGDKVKSNAEISLIIQDYFAEIFQAGNIDNTALATTLECIPKLVSDAHNESLLAPFTAAEVVTTLKSMGPDKSPGQDGMSAMFYQQNWAIVGDLVTTAVLSILNDGADPSSFNRTIITLIPKVKRPQRITEFRPISLCNVISKLVTKMLVARFKEILPLVISSTQSAFLPNRLITDNILVAFELVHAIKNKTSGRQGIASLKLDMSKAFDRVE